MSRLDEVEVLLKEALQLHEGLESVDEKLTCDDELLHQLRSKRAEAGDG